MTLHKINNLLLFLFCTALCSSQTVKTTYEQELKGINDTWHTIDLPVDAFAKASPYLTDLRIKGITVNKDTVFAPYFLETTEDKTTTKAVSFNILNKTRQGNLHFFTFQTNDLQPINSIFLDFQNENYDWNVRLEGSSNNKNWFTILNNSRVLSIENNYTSYRYNTLKFPPANYGYYRIAVQSKDVPELNSAQFSQSTTTQGSYRSYAIRSVKREELKEDNQTHLFITLDKKVPVSKIAFEVSNKYDYFRPIRIQYVTDSVKTEKGWMRNYGNLTSSTISSREPISFNVPSTSLKQLKIIIENGDNPPLHIEPTTIEGYKVMLVARFEKDTRYFLTYGDSELTKPDYDIERFKDNVPKNISNLTLGPIREVVTTIAGPTEPLFSKIAWLWAIMTVIMLVIGWYTVKMIRKQ